MARDYSTYRTHHTSRRLRGYDYTRPAAYFVTICAKDHGCLFGEIAEEQMHLNEIGRIVGEEWRYSEAIRGEITLDEYVIMPNHLHGIVVIAPEEADAAVDPHGYNVHVDTGANPDVATQRAASLPVDDGGRVNVKPKSLGAFVRAFKSAATKRINASHGTPGAKVWQPRYHDRIIRNEGEWRAIRQYIARNPARWHKDEHHPTRL